MFKQAVLAAFLLSAGGCRAALAAPLEPWMVLPPTPALPHADRAATAPVNGIQIWYAVFGSGHGSPVILLHGGLANSDYWANQIRALSPSHMVIVMDSRGHGRSARGPFPLGYDLMANDVLALLDILNIDKAAVAGWSDGAITALTLALKHPDRVSRVFAFAANATPAGVLDVHASPVFSAFMARSRQEHAHLAPAPADAQAFQADLEKMWATQPDLTATVLSGMRVPVWIVDGDHDEAIRRTDTDFLFAHIPGAREMILPGVSHFAFLQDPTMFNFALEQFLLGK